MASAAEPIWRTGAVGYEPSRLVGRARGRDSADQHDRRCDRPVVRAICGQRLHRGEHEPAGTLSEEAQAATGVLHRQSGDLSNCGENETRRQSIGEEPGRTATDADRPGIAGVGNPLDSGAQPAKSGLLVHWATRWPTRLSSLREGGFSATTLIRSEEH